MKLFQKNFINMLIVISSSALLYACGGSGTSSGGGGNTPVKPPLGSQTLNSILQTSESCTTTSCPQGIYLVSNANDLAKINTALQAQDQSTDQWSNNHYALLIKPGNYAEESQNIFELGYYTQILGVSESMMNTVINPGVQVHNQCGLLKGAPLSINLLTNKEFLNNPLCRDIGGLNNFWRGIENFTMNLSGLSTITKPGPQTSLIFAVSQASPLRSIYVTGATNPITANGLLLCDYLAPNWSCGYTSGGFMANSIIDDKLNPGSQQQWLARNSNINNSGTATWNSVFVGNSFGTAPTAPESLGYTYRFPANNNWTDIPLSIKNNTPIIAEKPYLVCDNCTESSSIENLVWHVKVPALRTNANGIDTESGNNVPVESNFWILSPKVGTTINGVTTLSQQTIAQINEFLSTHGNNLIITPGVYDFAGGSINVTQNDTIILGLGLPSLVCASSQCINISAEKGVRLAGVTLDAGYSLTNNLLQIGSQKNTNNNSANPIVLSDVFFRIAETQRSTRTPGQERQTIAAATIYTNNVIGDNLWFWRADHDKASSHSESDATQNLVTWDQDRAEYGLIVYGDNVTMYGLAVEHFRQYQTVWYGENGQVFFYQSEMPYDVPSMDKWTCKDPKTGAISPLNGCASYLIGPDVNKHQGLGFGVYTYFALPTADIKVPAAIQSDTTNNIVIEHIIGTWLNGYGSMANLVTNSNQLNRLCWGYGVSKKTDNHPESQFSVMGTFDNTVATQQCM